MSREAFPTRIVTHQATVFDQSRRCIFAMRGINDPVIWIVAFASAQCLFSVPLVAHLLHE